MFFFFSNEKTALINWNLLCKGSALVVMEKIRLIHAGDGPNSATSVVRLDLVICFPTMWCNCGAGARGFTEKEAGGCF